MIFGRGALYAFVILAVTAPAADAYIGPGAGFAVVNFLGFFAVSFVVAMAGLALFPIRYAIKRYRLRVLSREARTAIATKKVVVLGFDGMEPKLAEKMMAAGKLPHLASLRANNGYRRLGSTWPPQSPVAWSTFITGCNPGKHNVYDFLARDVANYLPELSIARTIPAQRYLNLGRFKIPLSLPRIEGLRKGVPFWSYLARFGVKSTIQRVPVTYPPEKFDGRLLSAMGTPDLLGTQGVYAFVTSDEAFTPKGMTGRLIRAAEHEGAYQFTLTGPEHPFSPHQGKMEIRCRVVFASDGPTATLIVGENNVSLTPGVYSPWVTLAFISNLGMTVSGVVKFLLLESNPHLSLYISPINIDPEKPAVPISVPDVYSEYLALKHGPYSTLGLAEDTSALNDGVLDSRQFLAMCYEYFEERLAAFRGEMERINAGLLVHVFDITDRVSHMFWGDQALPADNEDHGAVIQEVYRRCDALTGEVLASLKEEDLLIVLSDHGFGPYRYSIHLNQWLIENGYLVLEEEFSPESMKYFTGVDWSRSRAYAMGLNGIYINMAGRESQGIVTEEEAKILADELVQKISAIVDSATGERPIPTVKQKAHIYDGPYADNAPDLIIGYAPPYRASWQTVLGGSADSFITPNDKAWSGDHCIDPTFVPGVLFCNQPLVTDIPTIADIAPSVMTTFGVPIPDVIDGKSFLQ